MTPGDSETTGSYCRRFSTVTARPKPNARCRVGCAAGKSGPPLALLQKRGRGPSLDRDASAQADLARPGGGQPTQRNMKPRSGKWARESHACSTFESGKMHLFYLTQPGRVGAWAWRQRTGRAQPVTLCAASAPRAAASPDRYVSESLIRRVLGLPAGTAMRCVTTRPIARARNSGREPQRRKLSQSQTMLEIELIRTDTTLDLRSTCIYRHRD